MGDDEVEGRQRSERLSREQGPLERTDEAIRATTDARESPGPAERAVRGEPAHAERITQSLVVSVEWKRRVSFGRDHDDIPTWGELLRVGLDEVAARVA
jgi:hypothetical protein